MWSDNGNDINLLILLYFVNTMVLKEKLIIIANTPQQNGISKHKNRTLMGGVLTMLQQSKFIKAF